MNLLLLDIGNSHTHIALAAPHRIVRASQFPTPFWSEPRARRKLRHWIGSRPIHAAALCSVVPDATPRAQSVLASLWKLSAFELNHRTVTGVGIDYPRPQSIGPDRLANAAGARHFFGAPVVVVDFGTAVTFDVVNRAGAYAGGIIAPGLAAMTEYLHEKTALLPKIKIREIQAVIGKNTSEAMLIGAVHGYRGLIRELLIEIKAVLGARRLPVVATGGYAGLIAAKLPLITHVHPHLTLDGLRLVWLAHAAPSNCISQEETEIRESQ